MNLWTSIVMSRLVKRAWAWHSCSELYIYIYMIFFFFIYFRLLQLMVWSHTVCGSVSYSMLFFYYRLHSKPKFNLIHKPSWLLKEIFAVRNLSKMFVGSTFSSLFAIFIYLGSFEQKVLNLPLQQLPDLLVLSIIKLLL